MTYVKLEDLEDASDLLAALAHPIRLRIAAGLLDGGCCVGPMTECLQLPQPLVSRHLGILRDAGVVTVQPESLSARLISSPFGSFAVKSAIVTGAVIPACRRAI